MKRLLLLLTLLISVNAIGQITSASYTNKGATVPFINSSSYKLDGVTLDSANTVKRGFFTKYQYTILSGLTVIKPPTINNTLFGLQAGNAITSGTNNAFFGYRAGYSVTSGLQNTFIGHFSGNSSTANQRCVFVGYESGYGSRATDNIFIGAGSGKGARFGNYNTALGTDAGYSVYDGNSNIFIGYKAGFNEGGSNKLYIENSNADSTNALIFGNFNTNTFKINGKTQFGTTTNYTSTESDGTLVFTGDATVYKDAIVNFIYSGGTGEAKLDTYIGGIKQLKFLTNDLVYLSNTEAPHDWDEGTAIELHLHWMVKNALIAGDKVRWQLEYAVANIVANGNTNTLFCDPTNPTVFGSRTVTVEYTAPVGGIPAGTHLYTTFEAVTPTNFKIGAGFIGTLTRIAKTAGGTDPTTGSIFASNVGIHYKVNTIGSRTTSAK